MQSPSTKQRVAWTDFGEARQQRAAVKQTDPPRRRRQRQNWESRAEIQAPHSRGWSVSCRSLSISTIKKYPSLQIRRHPSESRRVLVHFRGFLAPWAGSPVCANESSATPPPPGLTRQPVTKKSTRMPRDSISRVALTLSIATFSFDVISPPRDDFHRKMWLWYEHAGTLRQAKEGGCGVGEGVRTMSK
jgi:hypothetical protein